MRRFGELVRQAEAKHALAVFDSCFSGTFFDTQRIKPPAAVTRATTLRVRQFVTSGDADQAVSDDGTFRKLFIRALRAEERADANGDGYLTASELGMFLEDRITNLTRSRQTPRYGKLRDIEWDRGDFVFELASSAAVIDDPSLSGPGKTTLKVEGTARGARVLIDGQAAGVLPTGDMAVAAGKRRVRVEKQGYAAYERVVDVGQGRAVSLFVDLSPMGPPKARLYVETDPGGARVRVLNIAPVFEQGMELEPGRYHVEVSSSGYETRTEWVALSAGEDKRMRMRLNATEAVAPPVAVAPDDRFTNSLGMAFVWIPPGEYLRGSSESASELVRRYGGQEEWYKREYPQHRVTLSRGFYMMTTEVTQGQWQAVMGANPSQFKSGDNYPVENVSWNDVQEFIRRLNQREGGNRYRLPTEAEWEYAARAGSTTRYCFGDDESRLGEYAWVHGNSGKRTQPVGGKKPNAWGLFDMHGNVSEWCQDWYGAYPSGTVTDPQGPSSGSIRVLRGGSWSNFAGYCRSADRYLNTPDGRYIRHGFRLVLPKVL